MVFCNKRISLVCFYILKVTILILIDGFLQFNYDKGLCKSKKSHNPYFNRWFSAIKSYISLKYTFKEVTILILIDGFLQYEGKKRDSDENFSHNPYFNRWFSAIK